MDLSSFLTSLCTSFVIFILLMFIFSWLCSRPGNQVIYYPNRILKGLEPWDGSSSGLRNPFAWIKEAISSKEEDIISLSGVDTAVYFVFLSTVLGILVISAVVLLPVLLPVAATVKDALSDSATSNTTLTDLDKISMAHIKAKSSRLWAFFIGVYLISFLTYYLLWKAYNHVAALRASALMSSEVKAEQFALLVRDIPPVPQGMTRKDQVDSFFKAIYPDTFYRSLIVTDNAKVNEIWEELEGYKKKLLVAEAVYAKSKTVGNPEGERPTNKTGLLGLIGQKVDTIEYLNEKITEFQSKLESEQKLTLREKQQGSAIVFFTNRVTATSAAQSLQATMVDEWTVMEAPEPRQIIWPNLSLSFYNRQIRQYAVYALVAVTILFYMIPIAFVSAFTTLQNLVKYLTFLKPIAKIGALKTILEAYLPQLALIIFLAVLPGLLLTLSKLEGIPSMSHAVRATSGKYFYFTVLNVFIGVTLGGTLFATLKQVEKNPNMIVTLLAASLPGNATFFLTYVALKFFVGYGLELSRIVPLIIFHLKKKYLCKTEGQIKEAWAPGDLGYATRVPGDMLILTISLCYSVIAPLILSFGVAYFAIGWLVLRNQALKVYVPSYESYGRMWPHLQIRIVMALLLYQVTMVGYFGVQKFYYTPLLIPLPIVSLVFVFVCKKKFYRFFQSTALEVVARELKESPNLDQVFRAFIPPSLTLNSEEEKFEDDQFEDSASAFSRSTSLV